MDQLQRLALVTQDLYPSARGLGDDDLSITHCNAVWLIEFTKARTSSFVFVVALLTKCLAQDSVGMRKDLDQVILLVAMMMGVKFGAMCVRTDLFCPGQTVSP